MTAVTTIATGSGETSGLGSAGRAGGDAVAACLTGLGSLPAEDAGRGLLRTAHIFALLLLLCLTVFCLIRPTCVKVCCILLAPLD